MTEKIYYGILSALMCIIPLYSFYYIVVQDNSYLPYNMTQLKDWTALLIVFHETINARKPYKIISSLLLFFVVSGYFFLILHWPGAHFLFFMPAFLLVVFLLMNNFKNPEHRFASWFILIYPLFHLYRILSGVFHFPHANEMFLLNSVVMASGGIAAAFLVNKLLVKQAEPEEQVL